MYQLITLPRCATNTRRDYMNIWAKSSLQCVCPRSVFSFIRGDSGGGDVCVCVLCYLSKLFPSSSLITHYGYGASKIIFCISLSSSSSSFSSSFFFFSFFRLTFLEVFDSVSVCSMLLQHLRQAHVGPSWVCSLCLAMSTVCWFCVCVHSASSSLV